MLYNYIKEHFELMAGNALKENISSEKRNEAIHEMKEHIKLKWEYICTENGKYVVHKTDRIVLLAQKLSEEWFLAASLKSNWPQKESTVIIFYKLLCYEWYWTGQFLK